jgi:hypothetical protein
MADRAKILVIDDNPSIHEDIRTILTLPSREGGNLAALEAVGRFVAGVTSKLEPPLQTMSEGVQSLVSSLDEISTFLSTYRDSVGTRAPGEVSPAAFEKIGQAEWNTRIQDVDSAVSETVKGPQEGLKQLSQLVEAANGFANPDLPEPKKADLTSIEKRRGTRRRRVPLGRWGANGQSLLLYVASLLQELPEPDLTVGKGSTGDQPSEPDPVVFGDFVEHADGCPVP